MRRRLTLPSPAMVVACLALVVALGGTSYAATKLPRKSVGREQLRDGAVGSSNLRVNAVDSSKVRDGTLLAKDLRAGVIPKPVPGTSVVRSLTGDPIAPGAVGSATAVCKPGERVTGGGGGFESKPSVNDKVVDTLPVGDAPVPVKWRISLFNGGTESRRPVAYAMCATG